MEAQDEESGTMSRARNISISVFHQGTSAEQFYQQLEAKVNVALASVPVGLKNSYLQCLDSVIVSKLESFAASVPSPMDKITVDWYIFSFLRNGETVQRPSSSTTPEVDEPIEPIILNTVVSLSSRKGRYWKLDSQIKLANNCELILNNASSPTALFQAEELANMPSTSDTYDPSSFQSGMLKGRLRKAIRDVPLFSGYNSTLSRDAVIDQFERMLVRKGDVIIRQGDPGEFFYFVECGTIGVYFEDDHNVRTRSVHSLSDDCYFGDYALLHFSTQPSTLIAESDCTLWRVNVARFRRDISISIDMEESLDADDDEPRREKRNVKIGTSRLGVDYEYSRLKGDINSVIGWVSYCSDANISPETSSGANTPNNKVKTIISPTKAVRNYQSPCPTSHSTSPKRSGSPPHLDLSDSAAVSGPIGSRHPSGTNGALSSSGNDSPCSKSSYNSADKIPGIASGGRHALSFADVLFALENDNNELDAKGVAADSSLGSARIHLPLKQISPTLMTHSFAETVQRSISKSGSGSASVSPRLGRKDSKSSDKMEAAAKSCYDSSDDDNFDYAVLLQPQPRPVAPQLPPLPLSKMHPLPHVSPKREGTASPRRDLLKTRKDGDTSDDEGGEAKGASVATLTKSTRTRRRSTSTVGSSQLGGSTSGASDACLSDASSTRHSNKLLEDRPVVSSSALNPTPKLFINVHPLIDSSRQDIDPLTLSVNRTSNDSLRSRLNSSSSAASSHSNPSSSNHKAGREGSCGLGAFSDNEDISPTADEERKGGEGINEVSGGHDELEDVAPLLSGNINYNTDYISESESYSDMDDVPIASGVDQVVLDIDLGNGVVHPLTVLRDSDPLKLSYQFIQKHSFSARYLEPLAVYVFKTRAKLSL